MDHQETIERELLGEEAAAAERQKSLQRQSALMSRCRLVVRPASELRPVRRFRVAARNCGLRLDNGVEKREMQLANKTKLLRHHHPAPKAALENTFIPNHSFSLFGVGGGQERSWQPCISFPSCGSAVAASPLSNRMKTSRSAETPCGGRSCTWGQTGTPLASP